MNKAVTIDTTVINGAYVTLVMRLLETELSKNYSSCHMNIKCRNETYVRLTKKSILHAMNTYICTFLFRPRLTNDGQKNRIIGRYFVLFENLIVKVAADNSKRGSVNSNNYVTMCGNKTTTTIIPVFEV